MDGSGGADQLDLHGRATANTFVVNQTSVASQGKIVNLIDVESVTLVGKDANDLFDVQATPAFNTLFQGGLGSDRVQAPNQANTWSITAGKNGSLNGNVAFTGADVLVGNANTDAFNTDLGNGFNGRVLGGAGSDTLKGANLNSIWNITANNGGLVGLTSFSDIENLVGAALNDTFVFTNGKSLTGGVDGGAGVNKLNYAAYTTGVIVNLKAGSATGIGGAVANIVNVVGGMRNDILVGNDSANTLSGAGGRDILIGGLGIDKLLGGGGDNILVGGKTDFDTNLAALNSILAEWSRTDLGYLDRVNHLAGTAGGLNAGVFLDINTVDNDNASDTLTGGLALDWFVASLGDVLIGKTAMEQLTTI